MTRKSTEKKLRLLRKRRRSTRQSISSLGKTKIRSEKVKSTEKRD